MGSPPTLSSLRQTLRRKLGEIEQLLEPAFEREPILPASLVQTRVRCGKPGCRCERGELHASARLQMRLSDGTVTRSIAPEQIEFFQPRVEAYRRLRQASRRLRAWQREVLEILEAIEHGRRSLEGLSEEDQRRHG